MISRTRELLHDTGRGFATENLFYETEEILLRLNDAKRRLAKSLLMRPFDPVTRTGGPAYVTLCRIVKQCSATDGTEVGDDFWYLLAGLDANNGYIPRVSLGVGLAFRGTGHDAVFVQGGVFYGKAVAALYWAYPIQQIKDSARALTEFPDGFYDTVELLAARDLLAQEQSDNADRWKLFGDLLMESVKGFQ